MILALAMIGVWLGLLLAAVLVHDAARSIRRREWWRVCMAALVGLGAVWRSRR